MSLSDILFNIQDPVTIKNGEEIPASPNSAQRTYQLKASWKMSDIIAFNQGNINKEELLNRIKIEKQ